jgi:crotonobetainyl-CoA:carnitine CoA-transferase CaiB-like acyl-CoA transferase
MRARLPFEGLRVVDFSWVWSGPLVGAWLSELGAQVIKIEHGRRLDNTRLRARPVFNGAKAEGPSIELHPYFHQANHGKLSITLNMKTAKGLELARLLVGMSDVLLENLTPGAMDRLGLGYEAVAQLNPAMLYVSMSAVGQTGPQANLRAYAPVMSSYAGIEAQVGYPDEAPLGMMNYGMGDPNAAIHGFLPLLAALYEREAGGLGRQFKGCHIDISQIEAMIAGLAGPALEALNTGKISPPSGNRDPQYAPYGIYPAGGDDSWVTIAVTSDAQWLALTTLIGDPALKDAELSTTAARLQFVAMVDDKLAQWTRSRSSEQIAAELRALDISCSPVLDVRGQWASAQARERGIYREISHPYLGKEYLYTVPWLMSDIEVRFDRSAPLLGEHNDYVFGTLLGMSAKEIAEFKANDIIA